MGFNKLNYGRPKQPTDVLEITLIKGKETGRIMTL